MSKISRREGGRKGGREGGGYNRGIIMYCVQCKL